MKIYSMTTVTLIVLLCICRFPLTFGNSIFMPGSFSPIAELGHEPTLVPTAINALLRSALGGPSTLQEIGGRPCGPLYGTMGFNNTCHRLLTRGPCKTGEWFVKKNGKDEGLCVRRPCASGQVYYETKCVNVTDVSVCNEGQMLYVSFNGIAHCDCEPNYFYDPFSGHCFTQHDKGNCNFGEYLDMAGKDSLTCIANPCLMENYAYHNETGKCFLKKYRGACKAPYFVKWDQNNQVAECVSSSSHTIFDLPTMRSCPPGSVRGYRKECCDIFHVPAQTTYPSSFGRCREGFIQDPSRVCRRTHRLFG